MPQIIVEYDLEGLEDEQLARLADTLAPLCARVFSVKEWKIRPYEFGFKFDKITPPSRSTHNVVVRIMLHDFRERLLNGDLHAQAIMDNVLTVLLSYGHLPGTSVGVSLGYLHTEWQEGAV